MLFIHLPKRWQGIWWKGILKARADKGCDRNYTLVWEDEEGNVTVHPTKESKAVGLVPGHGIYWPGHGYAFGRIRDNKVRAYQKKW